MAQPKFHWQKQKHRFGLSRIQFSRNNALSLASSPKLPIFFVLFLFDSIFRNKVYKKAKHTIHIKTNSIVLIVHRKADGKTRC